METLESGVAAKAFVRLYDVSSLEEADSGKKAVYLHPPLGESVVVDIQAKMSEVEYFDAEEVNSDHFRFPAYLMPSFLDCVSHLLKYESRELITE